MQKLHDNILSEYFKIRVCQVTKGCSLANQNATFCCRSNRSYACMKNTEDKYITPMSLYLIREFVVFLIWVYILIKIFIFDIDTYVFTQQLPMFAWVIDYKFIVLIVLLSVFWILSNKTFFKYTIALLLFYPFFLFLWRLPKLILKSNNWITIFGSINIIVSFLKNIKLNFLIFTVVITSSIIILFSHSKELLIISMVLLFIYMLYHFSYRVYYSFVPSKIFAFESETLINLWETHKEKFYLPNELKNIAGDEIPTGSQEKWSTNLQLLITFNRLCYFVASKLKSFQKSRIAILYFIGGVLFTLFITIIIFAFLNFALYKIDNGSFDNNQHGNIFFFIYYSFNTILTSSVHDFNPILPFARILNLIEIGFGVLILLILFFIKSTVQNEKYNEEIHNVTTAIEKQGVDLEIFVGEEFNLSVNEAIKEIDKLKGIFIKIIYYFSANIK